jgi:quaternary ammonium compound-resistance protein SugE
MAWVLLVIAGLFETAWAIGLKQSNGFTHLAWTVFTIVTLVVSMVLLGIAAKSLPIGTAYAVWVGIGAFGAMVLGMAMLGEPVTVGRVFFLGLLLVAIVGLKATGSE